MTATVQAPVALTVAGSDSGGGAGIQADLKTFAAFGVHGASAITAVTAQNTHAVTAVHVLPAAVVAAQLDAVFDDLAVRAVKLGMLGDAAIIQVVAERLAHYAPAFTILDPVMIASAGTRLLADDAMQALRTTLLPQVDCITPNLAEAAALLATAPATSEAAMREQGRTLLALGARAVLLKGGHAPLAEAVDVLVTRNGSWRFAAPWVDSRNRHGTGCTLASAVAAGMALGMDLPAAVARAKRYLTRAIVAGRQRTIGHGNGPLEHAVDASMADTGESTDALKGPEVPR